MFCYKTILCEINVAMSSVDYKFLKIKIFTSMFIRKTKDNTFYCDLIYFFKIRLKFYYYLNYMNKIWKAYPRIIIIIRLETCGSILYIISKTQSFFFFFFFFLIFYFRFQLILKLLFICYLLLVVLFLSTFSSSF